MTRPTDRRIITRALALLGTGILASALPGQLMIEFNLSRTRARGLAGEAMKRYKKQEQKER